MKLDKNFFSENIKTLIYALIIAVIIRSLLVQPFYIPSSSMEPTLLVGDRLFVTKYTYGYSKHSFPFSPPILNKRIMFSSPERGDVIVFKTPADNRTDYIKRLIGKPGDVIRIINKKIYVNGAAIDRKFIKSEDSIINRRFRYSSGEIVTREIDVVIDLYQEKHGNAEFTIKNTRGENDQFPQEWTIPNGHYFVMGDNRDNSNDSTKDVGFVPRENFFGRADVLFMTWECWTCIPSFSKAGKLD